MIKGMNRSGQSGGGGFTLIELLIALVVLVLVVIGLWMYFGRSNQSLGNLAPAVLDEKVNGCNSAVSTGGQFAYCGFSEVTDENGKKEYINCDYPAVKSKLASALTCGPNPNPEVAECNLLKTQAKDMTATWVNGQLCSDRGAK